jgi:hypothetical protein
VASFYQTITDAVADIAEYGYESEERLTYWLEQIRAAAQADLTPEAELTAQLQRVLGKSYASLVEKGGILRRHEGVERWKVDRLAPELRAELDRRIMASADLIKLNREQAIADMLRRFQGWATSIPAGGSEAVDKREIKGHIRKELAGLPFRERRVLIDQGHKLNASLADIIATNSDAIAAIWHSNWRQVNYNYRRDHKERDGLFYAIRGNWAIERGFMKPGPNGYTDQITMVGEEVFCRCLAPSTRIFHARDIEIISRRDYHGPVYEIISAAMPELPLVLTPNHPVLTSRGWGAAQELNVGDDLIEFCQENIASGMGIDHKNDRAPMISDIFESAAKTWGVRSIGDSRLQFHGDGSANGNVEIIRTARGLSLGIDSFGDHGADQFSLAEPDMRGLRSRPVYSVLERLLAATHTPSRDLAYSLLAFFFGQIVPMRFLTATNFGAYNSAFGLAPTGLFENRGIGVRSDIYSGLSQAATDCRIGDIELLCQGHRIPTAKIRAAKILSIKRQAFSGHVYNLQTKDEWYTAHRIISHNCYYTYRYNLTDLPEDMITAKGRAAIAETRDMMMAF